MSITKIEAEYKELLCSLKSMGATAKAIREDDDTFNKFVGKTMEYLNKVVLRSKRNWALINATGYEFDMFVDDIAMHIFLKLDAILDRDDEYLIPCIVRTVNNEVVNMVREWYKIYPKPQKSDEKKGEQVKKRGNDVVINFLDEVGWSMLADETNIEEELMAKETHEELCSAMMEYFGTCSCFGLVCLLATKVLTKGNRSNKKNRNRKGDWSYMKNRELAKAIDTRGLAPVAKRCFTRAAAELEIPKEVFSTFIHDDVPEYDTLEELGDKISKASNYCAVKLCKKMGLIRASKKQIRR